jgi:hypothetical protein
MAIASADLTHDREEHSPAISRQSQPSCELWDQALEKVRLDNPGLVEEYEKMLTRESGITETASRNEQMQKIIKLRLRAMQSRQWEVKVGGIDIKVREQIDRIVGVISAIRDVGSSVAALDPVHAGIPWAGVCVLLSVRLCNHRGYLSNK